MLAMQNSTLSFSLHHQDKYQLAQKIKMSKVAGVLFNVLITRIPAVKSFLTKSFETKRKGHTYYTFQENLLLLSRKVKLKKI